jgi:hypothetical protein
MDEYKKELGEVKYLEKILEKDGLDGHLKTIAEKIIEASSIEEVRDILKERPEYLKDSKLRRSLASKDLAEVRNRLAFLLIEELLDR